MKNAFSLCCGMLEKTFDRNTVFSYLFIHLPVDNTFRRRKVWNSDTFSPLKPIYFLILHELYNKRTAYRVYVNKDQLF